MNLRAILGWSRAVGLGVVFGLSACDSGETKSEEKKVEETKVEAKVVETKTLPEETKPDAPADAKAPEAPAGDAKAEAPAGDAKAEAPAEDAKAEAPAEDAKAEAPAADAKKTDTKKTETKKVEDKAPAIDGKPLYDSKCKVCHAADGKGTEAMKKNNIPDMSDKAWQGKHSKAAVIKAINEGVDGTKMKAFKDKLKPEEVDAIAAYVKKMK